MNTNWTLNDADATASVQNMVHGLEDKIKKDC